MTRKTLYIIILLQSILHSCTLISDDFMLNQALQLAENNRSELEKVLNYYANDPLKQNAAKYLIRNMPWHYSYVDTSAIIRYGIAVDSIVNSMREETDFNALRDSIDKAAQNMRIDTLRKMPDCKIITADFLIQNIDTAFYDWQQGPWAKHISFDDFCEWILPYKIKELQPLDNWRSELKYFCSDNLDGLSYCDQLRNSPLAATKVLNNNLSDSLKPITGLSVRYTDIPMEYRVRIPFGQCYDYACMAASVLRSHGIPVVVDFTPQWAKRNLGHAWNVIISEDGRKISFGGICAGVGELHKYEEKMAKVYRYTFSSNKKLIELNKSEEPVPAIFRNIFFRDITRETIQCSDVTLKVGKRVSRYSKYAYLLVFDNHDWVPVSFGKIKHRKVIFSDMGQNVLYLPATYSQGHFEPLSEPFILNYDGSIRGIIVDKCIKQDMVVERKYPLMEYAYLFTPRLMDGEFQASNDINFDEFYVAHHIKEAKAAGQYVSIPDSIPPCRYWRYTSNRYSSFCSIAEIMLYENGDSTKLQGVVIGTDGSWGDNPEHTKETVFDGDILTSFDAPHGEGCWVGIDLGAPKKVNHIIYYGRGDGNCVELGDEYELLYWNNKQWESLGTQRAGDLYVEYKDVPANGLYLLKDHTKGIDERIFTFEDGQQIWW